MLLLTRTEELLEAVDYATENSMEWHEVFDTKKQALTTLRKAIREVPEEHEVSALLSCIEVESDLYENFTHKQIYDIVLDRMQRKLQD